MWIVGLETVLQIGVGHPFYPETSLIFHARPTEGVNKPALLITAQQPLFPQLLVILIPCEPTFQNYAGFPRRTVALQTSHVLPKTLPSLVHWVINRSIHMPRSFLLASGSAIRAQLLRNAGVSFTVEAAKIDEATVIDSLLAEGASPRDIADTLAEMKARKISDKYPSALVLGCDQVLDHHGALLSKPETPAQALSQLQSLRGQRHTLLSAAVLYADGEPQWRTVGQVRLHMRAASDSYLSDYVTRNWESIQHAVGAYKIEEEGARLFHRIDGDYFSVLGLPLLDLLSHLTLINELPG